MNTHRLGYEVFWEAGMIKQRSKSSKNRLDSVLAFEDHGKSFRGSLKVGCLALLVHFLAWLSRSVGCNQGTFVKIPRFWR